jgi:hypothetical protein
MVADAIAETNGSTEIASAMAKFRGSVRFGKITHVAVDIVRAMRDSR